MPGKLTLLADEEFDSRLSHHQRSDEKVIWCMITDRQMQNPIAGLTLSTKTPIINRKYLNVCFQQGLACNFLPLSSQTAFPRPTAPYPQLAGPRIIRPDTGFLSSMISETASWLSRTS